MALVSNLHFGLTAWASGAFGLGQRCSSSSNAYQCITPGNSTSAPVGTGSSITSGTAVFKWLSAIDYTTLQAWANALPATLTQPVQLLVWNDGPVTTTAGVPFLTLVGHTTSATNNITVTPAPGESFAANAQSTSSVVPGWLTTLYTQVSGTTISLSPAAGGLDQYPFYGNTVLVKPSYWELEVNAPTSTTGFSAGLSPLGGSITDTGPVFQWHEDGGLWADGGFDSLGGPGTWPTYSTGDTLCLAYDSVHGMVYGRKGATGIWNNNPSANPATNTGGLPVPVSILTAGVVVGGTLFQNTNSTTAHFTVGSFIGTPPAGFGAISSGSLPLGFNSVAGSSFILPSSFGGINYFDIRDSNVTFLGLQFQDPNPSSGCTILQMGANFTAFGCIFDGYTQAAGAYMIAGALSGASGSVYKLLNNLIIDRAASGLTASTVRGDYSGVIANNTFVLVNQGVNMGCIGDNSVAAGITLNQTNNIILGYSNQGSITQSQNAATVINVRYGLLGASSLTNASVVAGAGNIYSAPIAGQFVNSMSDFRLLSSSQATGAGFTDTADIPSGVDIFGNARTAPWSIGAYQFASPTSAGSGGGQASGAGVSAGPRSIGSGGGHASGVGLSAGGAVGSGGGRAQGAGVSTSNFSVGSGGGQASGIAYDISGAISATITVGNPGAQLVNTAFPVSGTFTLIPELQVSDDATFSFTPIPGSGISPLGIAPFEFVHPGIATAGTYNLLVEDLSTDASAATNYPVLTTLPPVSKTFSPGIGSSLTDLSSIIPAYVYQEYSDDENIQAFFQAYNALAQGYLDWMNAVNLPIYTGLSGTLLDWVALGLYGLKRPVIASVQYGSLIGPFNTYQLDQIPLNTNSGSTTSTVFPVTDDIFKRIITWSFYRGDGTAFTVTWLKRRVMRFLAGANGTDYTGPATQVSVGYTGTSTINVTISSGAVPLTVATTLQAAVLSNVLPLPFQYTYNVLVNQPPPSSGGGGGTSAAMNYSVAANSQYAPSVSGF